MIEQLLGNFEHLVVSKYGLAPTLHAHYRYKEFVNLLVCQLLAALLQKPWGKVFATYWAFGVRTCHRLPAFFAQPMCTCARAIAKQWGICLLCTERFITYWTFDGLPVQQLLEHLNVLSNPLSVYGRHGGCFNLSRHLPFSALESHIQPLRTQSPRSSRQRRFFPQKIA